MNRAKESFGNISLVRNRSPSSTPLKPIIPSLPTTYVRVTTTVFIMKPVQPESTTHGGKRHRRRGRRGGRKHQKPGSFLTFLPDEIILHITTHLDLQGLKAMSLVSRRFRGVSAEVLFSNLVLHTHAEKNKSTIRMKNLVSHGQHLTQMTQYVPNGNNRQCSSNEPCTLLGAPFSIRLGRLSSAPRSRPSSS